VLIVASILVLCQWYGGWAFAEGPGGAPDSHGEATRVRVVNVDLRSLPSVVAAKVASAPVKVTLGDNSESAGTPVEPSYFADPLMSKQQNLAAKAAVGLTVDITVPGIDFTGAVPADVVGEVGGGNFVQMVNAPGGSVFAVYDADSGDLVAGPTALSALWQGAGACAEGWGQPGVVHDLRADRWVLSELGAGNHLCVYVSKTSNPVAGGWYAYDFALPKFPDFARIGVWTDGYYVATNEDLPAVYALERGAMLNGEAAGWQRFTAPALEGFGFQALAPADLDGDSLPDSGTGGLFLRHVDGQAHGGGDRLELFELDVDWDSAGNSSISGPTPISTAPFDSSLCGYSAAGCVPQPGTEVTLDPMREVVMWAVRYRRFETHESLVGNFSVDTGASNHAGIRWFELRRSGGAWSLHQEGTYSPDDLHRWIGSAAMDRDGNLALAFNVSSGSTTYPSIRVTGREVGDDLGVLTVMESELRAGTSAQTAGYSPERWGASSSLSISPEDDCTFWATAAVAEDGAWASHIASFQFPSCSGVVQPTPTPVPPTPTPVPPTPTPTSVPPTPTSVPPTPTPVPPTPTPVPPTPTSTPTPTSPPIPPTSTPVPPTPTPTKTPVVSDVIFIDGVESGDTTAWSITMR
jgi:hypothetical protein